MFRRSASRRSAPRRSAAAVVVVVTLALLDSSWGCTLEFVCEGDEQCALDGREGVCESDGYCSFPDSSCDSGRRYHDSASSTLAGRCTTPEAMGSSGDPPADPTSEPSEPSEPPVPGCGDGIVDEGEDCDDGNEIDGDGCNIDCRLSGDVVWNDEYDGLDDARDEAWGVVLSPEGDVFVAGRVSVPGNRTIAWVRKYDGDGTELWTEDFGSHSDEGNDSALTLALRPEGGLYVGGWVGKADTSEAPVDVEDSWLARIDPQTGEYDGEVAEVIFADRIGSVGNDRIRGITVAEDGDILVAGWTLASADSNGEDLWYGRVDPESLELRWFDVVDGGVGPEKGVWNHVAVSPERSVVAGSIGGSPGRRGWLRYLAADGAPTETFELEQVSEWIDVQTIPGTSDLVLAGTRFAPARAVAQRITPQGEAIWTGGWSEPEPTVQEQLYAVAVGPAGEIVITGRVLFDDDNVNDEEWDAWITKFDASGNHLWTRTHGGSAGSSDVASDVAVDQDGSVVIVGYRVSATNGRNIWVRKYTP
ncbi:MAG: hypothetical protein AAGF11_42910 [Myxococcota bacterium]